MCYACPLISIEEKKFAYGEGVMGLEVHFRNLVSVTKTENYYVPIEALT